MSQSAVKTETSKAERILDNMEYVQKNDESENTGLTNDVLRHDYVVDSSRGVGILKDDEGHVIRAYEGVDMKEVCLLNLA